MMSPELEVEALFLTETGVDPLWEDPTGEALADPWRGYAVIPLARAAAVAQALKVPEVLVWAEIERLAKCGGGAPFSLSSVRFRGFGISRKVKCRVLRALERAGFITVQWHTKRAPIVKLLDSSEPPPADA